MGKQIIRVGLRPLTTVPQAKTVSFGWSGKSHAQLDRSKRIELCRELWAELHTKQVPTQDWFDGWLARTPNFGCSCRSWAIEYIRLNPVDYDNFPNWACVFHNAVNAKLGKKQWPYLT